MCAQTQAGSMPRLARPSPQGQSGVLAMDAATRASLDILAARDGGPHSLLGAVQRTLTAPGARLLAGWLSAPLTDPAAIARRQDAWGWMLANPILADRLRTTLRAAPDMARALARLSLGRGGPRDLAVLRDGMQAARTAATLFDGPVPALLAGALSGLLVDLELEQTLAAALADPAPLRLDDAGVIRPGFDPALDAERALRDDSRRVLTTLQLDLAQRYGVASLKIRHHAQLGYVIEAPAPAVEKLRAQPDLTLRQGMASGARFTSPELSDLDRRITEAAERAAARERTLFAHLVEAALHHAEPIGRCAEALALLDVLQSAARLAQSGAWCRPAVTDDDAFRIVAGRHPVVEAALAGQAAFVPNDCDLSPDRRVLLLTGPNMAGKSTFLRQNALIAVLAQAGLPVPAECRTHRHDRPAVQPCRRRRRPGARPLHLHGGNDRNRRHPAPGRPPLAGGRRRDRARHRHPGRSRHRLGRAGSAAWRDSLPDDFCYTFPRTCGIVGPHAPDETAHDAGEGVEEDSCVPARGR